MFVYDVSFFVLVVFVEVGSFVFVVVVVVFAMVIFVMIIFIIVRLIA